MSSNDLTPAEEQIETDAFNAVYGANKTPVRGFYNIPENVGCWFSPAYGSRRLTAIIHLAELGGWDVPEPFTEDDKEQESPYFNEVLAMALDHLNGLAPTGYWFGKNEEEYGLWPVNSETMEVDYIVTPSVNGCGFAVHSLEEAKVLAGDLERAIWDAIENSHPVMFPDDRGENDVHRWSFDIIKRVTREHDLETFVNQFLVETSSINREGHLTQVPKMRELSFPDRISSNVS
jgi:hypothetical protein